MAKQLWRVTLWEPEMADERWETDVEIDVGEGLDANDAHALAVLAASAEAYDRNPERGYVGALDARFLREAEK